MDGIDRSAAQVREANELYWESETSVNQIANRLGLSKGSLYAAIEPLASESFCPLCTARLVYVNRTAHEKGHLQCSKCSTEFTEKGRSGPTRRSGAEVEQKAAPRKPARRQPAPREAAPRAAESKPPSPGPASATTPTSTATTAAGPIQSTPATPPTPGSPATPPTPATNGSHLAIAGDLQEPSEPPQRFDGGSGTTAVDDERASRQLVLSTAMLGLGVGLLLARVLRR